MHYATSIALLRLQDAADIRPYVLLSSWASSIPGVNTKDFIIEGDRFHPLYGEDNLPDPWENAGIKLIQKACNPYLVIDAEFWKINGKSNGAGAFPITLPKFKADTEIMRQLTIFNDSFRHEELDIECSLKTGSNSNKPFACGNHKLKINSGCKIKINLEFIAPPLDCYIFSDISVKIAGSTVFMDGDTCYEIVEGIISEWNYITRDDRSLNSLRFKIV